MTTSQLAGPLSTFVLGMFASLLWSHIRARAQDARDHRSIAERSEDRYVTLELCRRCDEARKGQLGDLAHRIERFEDNNAAEHGRRFDLLSELRELCRKTV